jgi:hypothetical protein
VDIANGSAQLIRLSSPDEIDEIEQTDVSHQVRDAAMDTTISPTFLLRGKLLRKLFLAGVD